MKKKTKTVPAHDVDDYLASVLEETRVMLGKLRKTIKSAAPKAEEIIIYQIPTYKYHGPLVHFVAQKSFCSFIVVSKIVLEKFKHELEGYDTSGTTIHFTAEKPLSAVLVKKIVKARVVENELRVTRTK